MRLRITKNIWMDIIGRAHPVTVLIIYLTMSMLFSFVLTYVVQYLDSLLEVSLTSVLNVKSNQFLQHSFSYLSNFLISFMFFSITVESYKIKTLSKKSEDDFAYRMSLYMFLVVAAISTVNIFFPIGWFAINLFFTLALVMGIFALIKKFHRFSDAIDLKIDIATVEQMNRNLRDKGFMSLMFQPNLYPERNILITCDLETYEDFHEILQHYKKDFNSRKMFHHFMKDKVITVDKNFDFIDANGNVLTHKDFLRHYYEYVADFKRLNARQPNKEFLGI